MFGKSDDAQDPLDRILGLGGQGLFSDGQAPANGPSLPVSGGPVSVGGPVSAPPDGGIGGTSQHEDRPREIHGGSGPASLGGPAGYGATPGQSSSPNPVAGRPAAPMSMPLPMLPAGASPTASRNLFGRAGGLLGGGLGVPGVLGDEGSGGLSDEEALMHMMMLMGGGGQQ